jgi:Fe2+ transport system protein B
MGCGVAGLMFLRHWTRTRERLFLFFAAAFFTMAANRLALVVLGEGQEGTTWVYLVRLAAFLLILIAIVEKNRGRSTVPAPPATGAGGEPDR